MLLTEQIFFMINFVILFYGMQNENRLKSKREMHTDRVDKCNTPTQQVFYRSLWIRLYRVIDYGNKTAITGRCV